MNNKENSRPNIIYILSGDQCADYLSMGKHPILKTIYLIRYQFNSR